MAEKTLFKTLATLLQAKDRPPVSNARSLAEKDALAGWIVENYLRNGSTTLPQVLERMADLRLCSLISRHLCEALFNAQGADNSEKMEEVWEALGMRLVLQPSGRLADTRSRATMVAPAKYRGFGSTLNNPDARGHLFQINLLCFPQERPVIGIYESPETASTFPAKGMREIGHHGLWRLFECSMDLTDDMTALLIKPDKGDVCMEFAIFDSKEADNYKIFYRVNTSR